MTIKSILKPVYVNPCRRDLLKQLAAMGVVGVSGVLGSSLISAKEDHSALKDRSVWRKDANYETHRRTMVWRSNTPSRYPDVMVQVKSEDEIKEALRFAIKNDLQVVCRASGHNSAGAVLRNGGMLLDLSALNDVSVNPQEMTAYVAPGTRMIQLTQALEQHGLDFPTAECHTVAFGGYLLGGGHAANGKHWGDGLSCYNVLSADVILASGEKVEVSENKYPELYWAIRGAGPGFFGIVTRFKIKLYAKPETILKNTYLCPLDSLSEIISLFEKLEGTQDKRLETSVSIRRHPESPDELAAMVTLKAFVDAGPNSEAEAMALLSAYSLSDVLSNAITKKENQKLRMSDLKFTASPTDRQLQDNFNTDKARAFLDIAKIHKQLPASVKIFVLAMTFNSQIFPLRENSCYSGKGRHQILAIMHWTDENDDEAAKQFFTSFNETQKPHASSHYINEVNNQQYPERIRDSFSKQAWMRLIKLRHKYDPDQRFYSYLGYS
jgi:hypothetical protein